VHSLAVSPDGKALATGSHDEIGLWHLATGRRLRRLHQQRCDNWSVVFSPDSKTLFSAGSEEDIHLWDPATGREQRRFKGHTGVIRTLALSADGKVLASRSADETIRVWNVATGKEARRVCLPGQWGGGPLALSPDGKLLAWVEGYQQPVRVWQVASGKELWSLPEGFVVSLAFSPDGRVLAKGGGGMVECWDVAGKKRLCRLTKAHNGIAKIAFSPDGKTLASVSAEGTVCLWDWAAGKARLLLRAGGPLGALAFTPNGRMVIAAGMYGRIYLWEAATGKALHRDGHDGVVVDVGYFPDGRVAATSGGDGTVRFWDALTGKERHCFGVPAGAKPMSLSTRGRTVLARGVRLLELGGPGPARWRSLADCGDRPVFALSPDGKLLASARQGDPLIVRDRASGKELRKLPGNKKGLPALALSPDGKLLAWGGYLETLRIWDLNTGKEVARANVSVWAAVFAPDGQVLAVGDGNDVLLCRPATGEILTRKASHRSSVSSLAFSPDGRLLASAAIMEGPRFRIWETATMQEVRDLGPHRYGITSLAFSPNGRTVLSGSRDTTALIWDVTGLSPAGKLRGPTLSSRQVEELWGKLADPTAARAWAAVWSLAADPTRSVPLLRARLRPVWAVPTAQLANWLADLDSDEFAVREKATRQLENAGEAAEPALRKVLGEKPSLEVWRRVEKLLAKLRPAPEGLRPYRALAVLEQAGTPEARRVLEDLAKGASTARFTQEARSSLERLRARKGP
jgi:WD40 repeat protein